MQVEAMEKKPLKQLPVAKRVRMPAMRRGLVKFADEVVLVTQEFLEEIAPSAQGTPIVIQHPGIPVVQENIDEGHVQIHGRVSEVVYVPETDEWDVIFTIDTQEGLDAMEDMEGISSGWYGQAYVPGGKHNNMPYDREAVKGKYEHFAIVPDPRYEMAKNPIYLNSLQSQDCVDTIKPTTQKGNFTMKLFKKIFKTEEINCNSLDEMYVNTGDEEISVASLIEAKKDLTAKVEADAKENSSDDDEAKENSDDGKIMANMDDEIEVDGEKIVIKSLVDEVKELRAKLEGKENSSDDEAKEETKENDSDDVQAEDELGQDAPKENEGDHEPKDDEAKENSDDEKKDDDEMKENSTANDKQKNFEENNRHVNNAHTNSKDDEPRYMTMNQKMNLGLELYGSSK